MHAVQPLSISETRHQEQQNKSAKPSESVETPPDSRPTKVHRLADGSAVELDADEVRIVDTERRLLVRYREGHAEICAARGDVTLSAPHGHVKLEAGKDVSVESRRDLHLGAGRTVTVAADATSALRLEPTRAELSAPQVEVSAARGRLAVERAALFADQLTTRARVIVQQVERYELSAERIAQRAQSVLQEVRDVIDTRVGRLRTRVKGAVNLHSQRTVMVSEQETSIDGERILLG